MVSFTDLSRLPQTARQDVVDRADDPAGPTTGLRTTVRDTRLGPDGALSAALAAQPPSRAAVIFLPTASANAGESASRAGRRLLTGAREGGNASEIGPRWRIQLRKADSGEIATVMVDDRSGAVERSPDRLAGDRAAQWIRWIHEGSHSGPVCSSRVLTGVSPISPSLGVIMWWRWRSRAQSVAGRAAGAGELQAAE